MANRDLLYRIGLEDMLSSGLAKAEGVATHFEGVMKGIGGTVSDLKRDLVAAFGIYKIAEYGRSVFETTKEIENLDNVINYTSGSMKEAQANHAFLQDLIGRYKLPLIETSEGFSAFMASVNGSSIAGEKARKIYEGVSTAVTALHLPAEKSKAMFYAMNNMMSLGTVQAQDLKLQMGNALPGAFADAARAMGMTQRELTKAMEQGQIKSEDFLVKFGDYLKQKYGGAIPKALESLQSQQEQMNNEFLKTKLLLGEIAESGMKSAISGATNFAKAVQSAVRWLDKHRALLKTIAASIAMIGVLMAGQYVASILAANAAWIQMVLQISTAQKAQILFNAVASINPYVATVAALTTVVYLLTRAAELERQRQKQQEEFENKAVFNVEQERLVAQQKKYKDANPAFTNEEAMNQAIDLEKRMWAIRMDQLQKEKEARMQGMDVMNDDERKQIQAIDAKYKKAKKFYDLLNTTTAEQWAAGDTTTPMGDLGSKIDEPANKKIEKITINLHNPFQNFKVYTQTLGMATEEIAPVFNDWLVSLAADAAITARR